MIHRMYIFDTFFWGSLETPFRINRRFHVRMTSSEGEVLDWAFGAFHPGLNRPVRPHIIRTSRELSSALGFVKQQYNLISLTCYETLDLMRHAFGQ